MPLEYDWRECSIVLRRSRVEQCCQGQLRRGRCGKAIRELFGEERRTTLSLGASACKGVLLRTGAGKGEHLSAKDFGAQGAIQSYGVAPEPRSCVRRGLSKATAWKCASCLAMRKLQTLWHTQWGSKN